MTIATANPFDVLLEAGVDAFRQPPAEDVIRETTELLARAQTNPRSVVVDLLRARREIEQAKQSCATAADAAADLEKMLQDLLSGSASLYHVETLRYDPLGEPQAVCRAGNQVQTFPLHPDVDEDLVATLQPWEYACVRERVVIDLWRDDEYLFAAAQGEIVDFKGYVDRERNLVRVSRTAQGEELVTLAGRVCDEELTPRSKLVLQRDNPRLAIASLPGDRPQSQFEVPVDRINTRLSDLACIEPLTRKLVLDIIKRVIRPDIREEYDLKPLRGMLLLSYRPGMGKTAFMRAFARWLHELGQKMDFDVVLYVVPPNATKSMWHGEDSRIVREDLFGAIRARRDQPRTRTLLQLVVMDEFDSLGRRPEAGDRLLSAAQSDSVQSFLAEMDGMLQETPADPPAHLLVVGMANNPAGIDPATKRPGRMGDLVEFMADLDQEGAEKVCAIYARGKQIPFQLNGHAAAGADVAEVRRRLIRPALARVFPAVVLRYASDTQKKYDVTAGQILSGAHYETAMNNAKNRAANRRVLGVGSPAVSYDDVLESLLETAVSAAAAMQADPLMLLRELQVKVPVARVEVVPKEELESFVFVKEVE
jgi:ATP-dependent 26S proteasome regulatory subunit